MPEVITLGETMVMMNPMTGGPLRYVSTFQKHVGGAETNVAVGVVRLGHSAGWISKVGADEFGAYVVSVNRGEGVDTSRVRVTTEAPTGVIFKELRGVGDPRVYYYRKGSAASLMTPDDLDPDYIAGARIFHVTGITPALSDSCAETVRAAMTMARNAGVVTSLDPNLRLKLWTKERFREVVGGLVPLADVVLSGLDEGQVLLNQDNGKNGMMLTPEEVAARLLERGPKVVALKMGDKGSYIRAKVMAVAGQGEGQRAGKPTLPAPLPAPTREEMEGVYVPSFPVQVADTIGAGDAFCAGFLTGLLKGYSYREAARLGNVCGAYAVTVVGDIQGLPTWDEVQAFLGKAETINR